MKAYSYYALEKENLIKLAESFNGMRKKIGVTDIGYQDFNDYYEKYFKAANDNYLGFDYIHYGYVLLNASVIIKTTDEQVEYNNKRKALSSFIAEYLILKELGGKINPNEICSKQKIKMI